MIEPVKDWKETQFRVERLRMDLKDGPWDGYWMPVAFMGKEVGDEDVALELARDAAGRVAAVFSCETRVVKIVRTGTTTEEVVE